MPARTSSTSGLATLTSRALPIAVEKLAEAARNPRNHRYSSSRGLPNLRLAVSNLYKRRFDVDLDPESEVVFTIGAKEGLSHLMWVLLGPGDTALVPSPSYPIHIYAPLFAGADVRQVRLGPGEDFFANLEAAWEEAWPRPKVIVFSFPHNPTTECVDLAWMQRIVDFARATRRRPRARFCLFGHVFRRFRAARRCCRSPAAKKSPSSCTR